MPGEDSRIRPLSSDVVAKLKSSTCITSLNEVILELAKNSLDADAQTVFVTVDYALGNCIVEDDGVGIHPDEFSVDHGALAKPHRESVIIAYCFFF